jgi:hypothetical protein
VVGSHRSAKVRCGLSSGFVMHTTSPLHWSQNIADGPQLGGKVGGIVQRTCRRLLNHTVVSCPAVLADVFVGIAIFTVEVLGCGDGEQGR